ncbi:hypothetical protein [Streptomyces aurantiogriseus]|uniref:Uncharacterized protein n=1 Tax=Streptomyces aurantiogriseus TaxID=66870 RepID=A0A918C1Z2_9ACTN|nr:hypothetical protein [Streptomyces aurantiogriseus]GGR02000.1 hypothetical protein GCM10010251_17160 [Streptomyces aurantiogriseus]
MPVDQHDPFEDRLSAALHQAGGTFDTNRSALAAAGQAHGRRLRLRRLAVAGSTASLVLVGVGAAVLLPSDGSVRETASVATNGTAKPGFFSADDVIRTLEKLLPEGKTYSQEGRGTHSDLPPSAQLVFDDGKGAAAVSVGLERIELSAETGDNGFDPASAVMPCPKAEAGARSAFDSCETEKLADGSVVTVFQGYEYPDRREETKAWGAELVTPEGQRVSVSEWNAPAEKGQPVSRPEPPLSTAQLKTLAAATQWRTIIDALPEQSRRPTPTTSQASAAPRPRAASGKVVERVLATSLPAGLKVVSRGHQETEYAYLVVDDGKGRTFVEVNVQPNMLDVAHQLYADAEALPDGTLVATQQQPDEKGREGVVTWTVDTMRKDGKRVVISAYNSADLQSAASRPEPALTIAQLREIALSPTWLEVG